ncbi:hypothetical protein MR818_03835 [bacterium]|nr:hypothetical protein [bacterium]
MKKEMMENATGVKVTKKASKNVIRSLSVGLAAMMALSTPIATFAEDVDGQNGDGTTPEESTTSATTQKSAAEQVKDVQNSDAAKNVTDDTNKAKNAVNDAVHAAFKDGSGADQTTKDAAGELDATANGTFEGGTDVNVAEEIVGKTMDRIEEVSDAAKETDAALEEADQKAEEANTIADDAKKEQQEAEDAFDDAVDKIDSATTIEDARNAYNQATGIVGDAQTAYETAKAAYDSKVAEYNEALDELKAAQETYDAAVAAASTEAAAAAANLAAVQQKAEELQKAAEDAKAAIPELTDAQKAALEIIALEKERAEDTSTNWRKEDELFKIILKNYYMPELIRGELVDCKWTWNQNDAKNYCEVTYTDVAGDLHTVYLNYKLNATRDDLVIFEKAEEVVSYDVKSSDGSLAFNINAENFPLDQLQNDQDTATYENNGVVYTIVNIDGQYYVVDTASKTIGMGTEFTDYSDENKYQISGEKNITYSVDADGRLIKTVKQNVSKITYTDASLSSDKSYDNVKDAEKALADEKAALEANGDKDIETSMSATATADVTVSQKTTFTTTIDLSKIEIAMDAIALDGDKREQKNAQKAADELLKQFLNQDALRAVLGEGYTIKEINTANAGVNSVDKYKNTSGRWVDWYSDKASYTGVFYGTVVITYSKVETASSDSVKLDKTNEVNATDNQSLETLKKTAETAAINNAQSKLNAESKNEAIINSLATSVKIKGYKYAWPDSGKHDLTLYVRYNDGAFSESQQSDELNVVSSSTTLSVSYIGTYQEKGFEDLGEQTVDMQKYKDTGKAEEVTDHTSNSYYDDYVETGKINEGIWLTGKDDDHFTSDENFKNFRDFKDAALKADAEKAEKEAKADVIIDAAKKAVEAVKTAKADVDSLQNQLTALLASQNYTADQVKELEGQISAAEAKLKEAEDLATSLTDELEIAGETLAEKIAELTPAPTPGEGGSTTTPSGTGTTSGGTTTTPASTGTTTTVATPTSTTTTVAAATAEAALIEIAETPVALAAAATPAAVTRTAAANANTNADADTNADENTDVTIADEETPLAATDAQESTTIGDEETPLAAEAGAVENLQQEKMSWWWLLIIALLGVTGEEMYRRNKKKKAEAAQKNEK